MPTDETPAKRETVEVPLASLVKQSQDAAAIRTALYAAIGAMTRARGCLTPGMKAGTSGACEVLDIGMENAQEAMKRAR